MSVMGNHFIYTCIVICGGSNCNICCQDSDSRQKSCATLTSTCLVLKTGIKLQPSVVEENGVVQYVEKVESFTAITHRQQVW